MSVHAAADDGFEMSLVPLPPSFGLGRAEAEERAGQTLVLATGAGRV